MKVYIISDSIMEEDIEVYKSEEQCLKRLDELVDSGCERYYDEYQLIE